VTTAEAHSHHHARRWAILAFLGLAQLMVVLDATVVNIAMPTIQHALHFSDAQRQWIVTAYSLAFGSLLFLGGRMSDVLGRKATLIVGLVGFAVASAIGGASTSFTMLVIARAIQGAFGAVLAPAALAMLTTIFTDAKERATAFSIYGAIASSGAALGLLLGGVLTQYASWRWTLYVNLIIAVIALVGVSTLLVHARDEHHGALDVTSTVLVSTGLFGIVYGLSHAAESATTAFANHTSIPSLASSFGNATTLVTLAVGLLLVAAFVRRQSHLDHPMLPLSVVKDRLRGGAFLAIFLSAIGMFAVFLFLAYYLQEVLGFSPVMSGVAFLPMPATISVVAIVTSTRLLPKYGPRPLMSLGMVLAAGGMYYFTHLAVGGAYASHVLGGLIVTAMGMGLIFAPAMNVATYRVRRDDAGAASATVNVAQQIGGSIGTALLNTVAVSTSATMLVSEGPLGATRRGLDLALVHGYTTTFWWAMAIFLAGGAVAAAVIPRGRVSPAESEEPVLVH
jgi:EmrB/QacA subfamily drug resistance transporter